MKIALYISIIISFFIILLELGVGVSESTLSVIVMLFSLILMYYGYVLLKLEEKKKR